MHYLAEQGFNKLLEFFIKLKADLTLKDKND